MKKRIFSMLVAIVMVIGLVPATALTAFAAENTHTHAWSFAVDREDEYQINATCTADGCTETDGGYVTLYPVYENYTGAAIEADLENALVDESIETGIVYGATEGFALTEGKPVNVGAYTASLTLGEATVTADIEIYEAYIYIEPASYMREIGSPAPDLTAEGAYTAVDDYDNPVSGAVAGVALRYVGVDEPDMTKAGSYTIEVNEDALTLLNTNYVVNTGWGELLIVECIHDFTSYYVEGASIYGVCAKDCDPVLIVKLEAPEEAVYEEGLYHTVNLYGGDYPIEISSEDVVYTRDGQPADPVEVGTYTASITYGGVTASVTYDISAPATLPEARWGANEDDLTASGTLAEALEAAAEDSSITYIRLAQDPETTDPYYIEGGVFTLDLNDRQIVSESFTLCIQNIGTVVTLKNGAIISTGEGTPAVDCACGAKVVIESGVYEGEIAFAVDAESEALIKDGYFASTDHYTVINDGTLTVLDGSIEAGDETALISFGTTYVRGGSFTEGTDGAIAYYGGLLDLSAYEGVHGLTVGACAGEWVENNDTAVKLPEGYILSEDGCTEATVLTCGTVYTVIECDTTNEGEGVPPDEDETEIPEEDESAEAPTLEEAIHSTVNTVLDGIESAIDGALGYIADRAQKAIQSALEYAYAGLSDLFGSLLSGF